MWCILKPYLLLSYGRFQPYYKVKMNIMLSGYRKYYGMLLFNRICNYNEGLIKNRFFWGGRMGVWAVGQWILLATVCQSQSSSYSRRNGREAAHSSEQKGQRLRKEVMCLRCDQGENNRGCLQDVENWVEVVQLSLVNCTATVSAPQAWIWTAR